MSTALQIPPDPRLQTLAVRRLTRPSLGRLATTAAPYRGASSDRSCAILKHPLNLKKGFQVSNPIRVAVLGFWHVHAAEYAARVREHPDTELVAVWDDDLARGQAAADAAVVPFVHDLDALLARDDLDAVTVTTATTEQHAIMLRVIQAGSTSSQRSCWRRPSQRQRKLSRRPTMRASPWWCHSHGSTTDIPERLSNSSTSSGSAT